MKKFSLFLFGAILISFVSCEYNNLLTTKDNIPPQQSDDSLVLIKAAIKIAISGIVYENLDGRIRISGYNSNNATQWTKEYDLIGPLDTLVARNGFHHYRIELVDKWGVNDIQDAIPGKDIWDGRANGPLPVTYVFGGALKAKKLASCITSSQTNVGINDTYVPNSKDLYAYNIEGQLEYIHHQTYNTQTSQFEETSLDAFTYDSAKVSKIKTTLLGNLYSEFHYAYGNENTITEILYYDNNLVWTQTSTAKYDSGGIIANYGLSNGNSFSYEFDFHYKNIIADKTTQSGQLCNQGKYTYDKNINPFRHLEYVDFYFLNWSSNNRLTEDVNYLACGFPSVIPVSYDYTYDKDGYPINKITTYKSSSNYHSKIDFYYE